MGPTRDLMTGAGISGGTPVGTDGLGPIRYRAERGLKGAKRSGAHSACKIIYEAFGGVLDRPDPARGSPIAIAR